MLEAQVKSPVWHNPQELSEETPDSRAESMPVPLRNGPKSIKSTNQTGNNYKAQVKKKQNKQTWPYSISQTWVPLDKIFSMKLSKIT